MSKKEETTLPDEPTVPEGCGCSHWVQSDGGYVCQKPVACPVRR